MDSLREYLKSHPRIHVIEESKLFYGKFPFRVLVRVKPTVRRPKILFEWLKALGAGAPKGQYRVQRYDMRGINVYLKTAEACLDLMTLLGTDIRAICLPEDETHLDILSEEADVQIRKRLYWGRFRYLVVCRWMGREAREDIEHWLGEVFGAESLDFLLGSSYPMKIYFIDHKATALFKIAHSKFVNKIHRAVLLSEIPAKESSSDHDAFPA